MEIENHQSSTCEACAKKYLKMKRDMRYRMKKKRAKIAELERILYEEKV